MKLVVNGEARELSPSPATVDGLLVALGLPKERVAVELNGDIVVKADRPARAVKDGDVLEIVTLVGGG
jgi:thiamine biosynthesis protein ThiS